MINKKWLLNNVPFENKIIYVCRHSCINYDRQYETVLITFCDGKWMLKICSVTVCCCESEISVKTVLSFLNGYVSA